ncbi:transporter [Methylobacterium sp. GXS13]|uniref:AI-2E family transporter n=1 Tax=unclassified Methylobacterium TaxID=2615210 RepID=UPI00071B86E0|nr:MULTISPECIES: AI-2E family transporter [unclassified Methylobacterium]KST57299.1 transporter [Methylobacterium sp. GXS13]MCJ2117520.1 AI-2E family transporter [Methylobacterium sp. J-001]
MTDGKLQDLDGPVGPWRGALPLAASGIAVVCFTALLALAWMSVGTLLLIFAGVLLGVFLDGLTRGLGHVLPLPRGLRLTIASLAVAVAVLSFGTYGGATVVQQGRDLGTTIKDQAGTVSGWLSERGIDVPSLAPQGGGKDGSTESNQKEGGLGGLANGLLKGSSSIVSDAGSVLGPAAAVILGLFDALGNLLVIAFLGLAFAADPKAYRDGALRFVPPQKRPRAAKVLDGAGETLRHWLFGQLIIMAAIFLCTWAGLAFLGIGGALILGLQAGLLAFVPTVGPLVAGIVIILAALASGLKAVIGAVGVYLAVQCLESYGLTPFIQKRALDIPPATIFAGQLILGVIFGLWGIALALPLMAVIKVLLEQLYVEDTLHEPASS